MPIELIAPAMGYADMTIVERVYGRLSTHELQARCATHFGITATAKYVTCGATSCSPTGNASVDCNAGGTDAREIGGFGRLAGRGAANKSQQDPVWMARGG